MGEGKLVPWIWSALTRARGATRARASGFRGCIGATPRQVNRGQDRGISGTELELCFGASPSSDEFG